MHRSSNPVGGDKGSMSKALCSPCMNARPRLTSPSTVICRRQENGATAIDDRTLRHVIGWVFFRAQSLPDVLAILSAIVSPARYSLRQIDVVAPYAWIVALTLAFFLLEFLQRRKTHVLRIDDVGSAPARAAIYLAFLLAIFLLGAGTQAQFIYFRF